MNTRTLILVDLSGIAHPIWATLDAEMDPDARLRTGRAIVQRVYALVGGHPHVAICCDAGRSFRHDLEPTYKRNRPERDAVFVAQVNQAQAQLTADGFPVWRVPGFEADDLIATAVGKARAAGWPVVIVSADKDLLALVTDEDPAVLAKKPSDGSEHDVESVAAKFGVLPVQVTDFLTLVGDASDNIHGAKGIGPKRAAELLAKFHTLDELMEALVSGSTGLTPSLVQALRDFAPRLEATRTLVRMRTDAPIPTFEAALQARETPAAVIDAEVTDAEPETHTEQVAQFMAAIDEGPAPKPLAAPAPTTVPVVQPVVMAQAAQPVIDVQSSPEPVAKPEPAPKMALVPAPTADLAPAPAEFERQLEPRSFAQANQLAQAMFQSRLFSAYGTQQGVLATVLAGREMGMSAMASLRAFHIVEGKPTMAADLIRALVLKSGLAEYFRCTERTAERATFVTKRRGEPEMSLTYTIAEGRAAFAKGDDKWAASGWGRNPADMLVARAGSKLARLVYPDVLHGIYATEELEVAS